MSALKKQRLEKKESSGAEIMKAGAFQFITVIVLENCRESGEKRKQVRHANAPEADLTCVVVDSAETINEINAVLKLKQRMTHLFVPQFAKNGKKFEIVPKAGVVLADGDIIHIKSFNCKFPIASGDKLKLFSVMSKVLEYNIKDEVTKVETGAKGQRNALEFGFARKVGSGHLKDLSSMNICPYPDDLTKIETSPYIVANIRTIFDKGLKNEKFMTGTNFGLVVAAEVRAVGESKENMATYGLTIYDIHDRVCGDDTDMSLPALVENEIFTEMYGVDGLRTSSDVNSVSILSNHNIPFTAVMRINAKKTQDLIMKKESAKNQLRCSYVAVEWDVQRYLGNQPLISKESALKYAALNRQKMSKYDTNPAHPVQNLINCSPVCYTQIEKSADGDYEFRALISDFKMKTEEYTSNMTEVMDAFCASCLETPGSDKFSDAIEPTTTIEVFAISTSNKRKRE